MGAVPGICITANLLVHGRCDAEVHVRQDKAVQTSLQAHVGDILIVSNLNFDDLLHAIALPNLTMYVLEHVRSALL